MVGTDDIQHCWDWGHFEAFCLHPVLQDTTWMIRTSGAMRLGWQVLQTSQPWHIWSLQVNIFAPCMNLCWCLVSSVEIESQDTWSVRECDFGWQLPADCACARFVDVLQGFSIERQHTNQTWIIMYIYICMYVCMNQESVNPEGGSLCGLYHETIGLHIGTKEVGRYLMPRAVRVLLEPSGATRWNYWNVRQVQ